MDPVTEIVTALGAGTASAPQDGTKDAVKAAYAHLHELVKERFSGHPSAEMALAGLQAGPQAGEVQLAAALAELGAADDSQLVNAARELLLLLNDAGKFSVKARGFRGGQFGDGNVMINFNTGSPDQPDAADGIRLALPALPSGERPMSGPPAVPALAGRAGGRHWSAAFTSVLAYSLGEFPSMGSVGFRDLFLRRVREQLGVPGALGMSAHDNARVHILAIVFACQDHEDPVAAVKALHDVMSELCPGTGGVGLLEDCYLAVSGMAALSIERLHSVLEIIGPLSWECDRITAHGIAREAALDGEILPLRGTEDLVGIVRRLNVVRISGLAQVPLVVRFLARLAGRVGERPAPSSTLRWQRSCVSWAWRRTD